MSGGAVEEVLMRWRQVRERSLPWSANGEACRRFEDSLRAWAVWLSEQEHEAAAEARAILMAILEDAWRHPWFPPERPPLREERLAALVRLYWRVEGRPLPLPSCL